MEEKKKSDQKVKQSLKYQQDKDAEIVKGIFRYYEVPGGSVSFCYKKYKGPIEKYTMVDGQVYSVPLGVAKHLNTNCWYPEYGFIPGESEPVHGVASPHGSVFGRGTIMSVQTKKRRMGFQSLEFVDIEELQQPQQTELVKAQYI